MNIKKRELDSCLDKIDEAICKDREFLPDSVKPPGMETLSLWFRSLTSLQHVEGGVDEFCNDAARTITEAGGLDGAVLVLNCLLYTSPSPRDRTRSRMPSSA